MFGNVTAEEKLESFVRENLVLYPRTFMNPYGKFLPLMRNAVQCQFNKSGHGFDILALDTVNWNLWVIEVSAGKPDGSGFGQFLMKTLENGACASEKAQMSPEWRLHALEGFVRSPDLINKLATLFGRPESEPEHLLNLLNLQLNDHSYAVIVPEGVPVKGDNPLMEFACSIYTFRFSVC